MFKAWNALGLSREDESQSSAEKENICSLSQSHWGHEWNGDKHSLWFERILAAAALFQRRPACFFLTFFTSTIRHSKIIWKPLQRSAVRWAGTEPRWPLTASSSSWGLPPTLLCSRSSTVRGERCRPPRWVQLLKCFRFTQKQPIKSQTRFL